MIVDILKVQPRLRNKNDLQKLVPTLRNVPFFRDRGMNDASMMEVVNCMHLRTMKAEDFVFEYGSLGEEFFLILEGEVEIQIPDKD